MKTQAVTFAIAASSAVALSPLSAFAQTATGASFVDTFSQLDQKRWYISDGWNNGPHQNCNWAKDQVKVEDGHLVLGFEQRQTKDRSYVCGELQTRERFGFGTYEIRMKAASGSGLNSAFFTYIGPTDKQQHDEIDFEVLGKNTAQVQLNQYVNGKGGNEKLVPVAGGADQAFNDYAFVWEKDRLRYYVNGKLVHEVTDATKIPQTPQKIFASLWGTDTLKDWMGAFSYNGPVSMQVERIAYTAPDQKCLFPESVTCSSN